MKKWVLLVRIGSVPSLAILLIFLLDFFLPGRRVENAIIQQKKIALASPFDSYSCYLVIDTLKDEDEEIWSDFYKDTVVGDTLQIERSNILNMWRKIRLVRYSNVINEAYGNELVYSLAYSLFFIIPAYSFRKSVTWIHKKSFWIPYSVTVGLSVIIWIYFLVRFA